MELELYIKGTIEEISQITALIDSKVKREKELLHPTCVPASNINVSHVEWPYIKRKKTGWIRSRAVDILIGSSESWFAIWKSYNTMQAAAQALWLKEAANIQHYLKNDRIYKGMYKFQYRDQPV